MRSRVLLATVTTAVVVSLAGCSASPGTAHSSAPTAHEIAKANPVTPAPVVPADGSTLFGVHLDWNADSPASYLKRSGVRPEIFGDFLTLQPSSAELATLGSRVDLAAAAHANIFLTIEPTNGLASVTAARAQQIARSLASWNKKGVWFYIRFAHEMNGSWYPWGQQPAAYISAFRTVATAMHQVAPGNSMIWSPNDGGGYPFIGGRYSAKPGTADFAAMDTNHDHALTVADDPYAPFYPGDAYVDWVGLTLYYFGQTYPYGANTVPDNRFMPQLDGTYDGASGDERALPSFYQEFAVAHHKPMAISETAALYNTSNPTGASEAAIKTAWIKQVLNPADAQRYPDLKMVNWFEFRKNEAEDHGIVDWRASSNPVVLKALQAALASKRFASAR